MDKDDNTWTLEQRYEAVKAQRDELEFKLFRLAELLRGLLDHEYTGCAVNDCLQAPDFENTNLPLCATHLWVASVHYSRSPKEDLGDLPPEYYERQRQIEARRSSPAVYYIQMNQYIKIGTTTDLRRRLATFSNRPADLLAVEPGGKERERERHLQFKSSRLDRGELFAPTPELLAHIALARTFFGDPARFLDAVLS